MAYYSGQATSYQEIIDAVVDHLQSEGWAWNGVVLSKENVFVSLQLVNVGSYTTTQNVIRLVGGSGLNGSNLLNSSPIGNAIGTFVHDSSYGMTSFPIEYNLHINDLEVYLICNYNIEYFMWLAFGAGWIGGTFGVPPSGRYQYGHTRWPLASIWGTGGGAGNQDQPSAAFFWNTNYSSLVLPKNYTGCVLFGSSWYTGVNAIQNIAPLVDRQPNNWNNEALFLPINVTTLVGGNKSQILKSIQTARYIRLDNFEPKQIIQMGSDKWKVYPFYRKNSAQRNGGFDIDHTGTFGWAIRYDGP